MKFLGRALILALGLPGAAGFDLKESGDCAVHLNRQQCEEAAADFGVRFSPKDVVDSTPFAREHIPGGCFAVKRDDGTLKKTRWNTLEPPGTDCDARRPCVCGPACAADADLAARYGPQLCPDQIAARFERKDGTRIQTYGMPQFLGNSAPQSDGFATWGLVEMDLEEAASVCATKCANDPDCDAVSIIVEDADKATPYTGHKDVNCIMVNTDLDGEAYLLSTKSCSCQEWVTFEKKASTPLPKFEDHVQCNINATNTTAAVTCTVLDIYMQVKPEVCDSYLTPHWNEFMKPGIQCLINNGGQAVVNDCLACLDKYNNKGGSVTDVCRKNATDTTTFLRDPAKCANNCTASCVEDLETNLLCLLGSPDIGYITGPNFACPEMEETLIG